MNWISQEYQEMSQRGPERVVEFGLWHVGSGGSLIRLEGLVEVKIFVFLGWGLSPLNLPP
jgi:hypothetical protein